MKSKKEINKQNYRRKRDSIKAKYSPAQRKLQHNATYSPAQRKLQHKATYSPAQRKLQHDATYSPAQRKLQHKATYSPAQRKLEYIQQKSASAQKVRNEQFCNHRSARSASNQAGIKLPIEIRESLTHASKCDQKSMQVEGKWCLPVCLICNKVIFNCETMQTLDKKIVLPQKQSSAFRNKILSTTCKCMRS